MFVALELIDIEETEVADLNDRVSTFAVQVSHFQSGGRRWQLVSAGAPFEMSRPNLPTEK